MFCKWIRTLCMAFQWDLEVQTTNQLFISSHNHLNKPKCHYPLTRCPPLEQKGLFNACQMDDAISKPIWNWHFKESIMESGYFLEALHVHTLDQIKTLNVKGKNHSVPIKCLFCPTSWITKSLNFKDKMLRRKQLLYVGKRNIFVPGILYSKSILVWSMVI